MAGRRRLTSLGMELVSALLTLTHLSIENEFELYEVEFRRLLAHNLEELEVISREIQAGSW